MTTVKIQDARGYELIPEVTRIKVLTGCASKREEAEQQILKKGDGNGNDIWVVGLTQSMLKNRILDDDTSYYGHEVWSLDKDKHPLDLSEHVEYILIERIVDGKLVKECHGNRTDYTFVMNNDGKTIDKI